MHNQGVMPESITLAAGCYWCTEAIFTRLRGVSAVEPGFAADPGHPDAEGVQIEFDPAQISVEQLLTVYFATHDPTQLNRQGPDEGEAYRSAVFAHSPAQRSAAQDMIAQLTTEQVFSAPIVTQIRDFAGFRAADARQRRYYDRNRDSTHCQITIAPKLAKLRKAFASWVVDGL
jgi:peptide-methionine (S)-S-oxide reductase